MPKRALVGERAELTPTLTTQARPDRRHRPLNHPRPTSDQEAPAKPSRSPLARPRAQAGLYARHFAFITGLLDAAEALAV